MMNKKELKKCKKEIKEVIKTVENGSDKFADSLFEVTIMASTIDVINRLVMKIKEYIDDGKIPDGLSISINNSLPCYDYNCNHTDKYTHVDIQYSHTLTMNPTMDHSTPVILTKYANALYRSISSYRNNLISSSPSIETASQFTADLYNECCRLLHQAIDEDMGCCISRLNTLSGDMINNNTKTTRLLRNIIRKKPKTVTLTVTEV